MIREASLVHSHIGARNIRPLVMSADDVRGYAQLAGIGINLSDRAIEAMVQHAMDSNDTGLVPAPLSGLSTPSITTPVQFLQNWLPGMVRFLTAARMIDTAVGIATVGSWEDEQIVQAALEPIGTAMPYGDYNNVPLSSWNLTFNTRTVVRFELGLLVGVLEEARAARVRVSSSGEKRSVIADALEIQRNRVGFYGFNDGSGQTMGLLNDTALPAYVTVANGASASPLWSSKTFLEITADIRAWAAGLQTSGFGNIDPMKSPITLLLPLSVGQYLTVMNVQGTQSVKQWIEGTYPNWRIEFIPEFNDANGGASAAYLFCERVDSASSDDNATFMQVVPTKFNALGVERRSKSYVEDYSNATAGVMCKRPWAVYRATGI